MSKSQFELISHQRLLGILFVLAYLFLMAGNGLLSLTHPDEVFYILSAREMVQHNSWLTPMIFNHIQFEKPILPYALFAFAIKTFGEGPFVARFWPAFAGILGVMLTYWMAWMLFHRKKVAFLAGLILTSSIIFVVLSHAVLTDMIFTSLVAASIGFFCLAMKDQNQHWRGMIWGFVFCAAAVLTKGILGFIFTIGTMLFYLFWTRQWNKINFKALLVGLILFLILALPWHVIMIQKYGHVFIDEYFKNVHFRRLVEAEHKRLNTFYFYPMVMFIGLMPWSFFWIFIIQGIRDKFHKTASQFNEIKFLLGWIAMVFVPLQIAASKLASYILPAFPALAILMAYFIILATDEKQEKSTDRALMKLTAWLTGVFFVLLMIGAWIAKSHFQEVTISSGLLFFVSIILFVFAIVIVVSCYRRQYGAMAFGITAITALILFNIVFLIPQLENLTSSKKICEVFNKMNMPKQLVFTSKILSRAVYFYTGNPVAVIDIGGSGYWSHHPIPYFNVDQQIIDYLNKNREMYAIVRDRTVEDFNRLAQSQPYDIKELYSLGGKKIIHVVKRR